jgi:hypothetical protein
MLRTCLLLVAIAISVTARSQKQSITWGDEFKVKKGGSNNIRVLTTDSSGIYLEEMGWSMKSYYVIGASMRTSATLVKLDKDLRELYRSDLSTELSGKEFEYFFACKDKILIIASAYNGDWGLDIFAAEVDRSSGHIIDPWKPIAKFQKENINQEISFKLIPNADTSTFIVISSVTGNETNTFKVQEFGKDLKATSRAVTISNEFEANTYQLEDVLYTADRKIVLVGRVYEYQEDKKKKSRFLDFASYNIRIYNENGKQISGINTSINGKWLINTKVLLNKRKELVLASFFSREKKGATNGLLIQRIDMNTGQVISTTEKEINYALLTADSGDSPDDGDKDDYYKDRKEEKRFSKYMRFRNIFYTADGGLVLLAENFNEYTKTTTVWQPGKNGGPDISKDFTNYVYESGEILMCKIDAAGSINWLQVLPKVQREFFRTYNGAATGVPFTSGFFDLTSRPFYSGFGAMQSHNKISIFFNDHPKNAKVLQPGQGVFHAKELGDSHCFVVTLDEVTGKYKRKDLFSNSKVPAAMLRHGAVIGHDMFIVGKTERTGRTKLAVARISLK